MGTGARYERAAYGQARGEAAAIQEHQLAMIPIIKEQAEVQFEIQEKKFAQEIEQTKAINLLAQQLQPDPILVPAAQVKPGPANYLVYAGLAIMAYFLLRKMKWL